MRGFILLVVVIQVFVGKAYSDGDEAKRNIIQVRQIPSTSAALKSPPVMWVRTPEPTYPEIINNSLKGIVGSLASEELKDILLKYYFTDKKEMSIWPKAIEETEKSLNLEFTERELFEMENDIKSIYRRMLECDLVLQNGKSIKAKRQTKKRHAKCYMTLNEYIDDGFTDFGFPRGTLEGQAQILQMNMAFNLMSLLILQMSVKVADDAKVSSLKVAKPILDIAENLERSLKTVTKNTIDARIQAISQIEICLMQEVLWQEFQVTCEFRMKRDVETASGIGGPSDKFQQKYRAKVIDGVTKKEVCNIAKSTSTSEDKNAVKTYLTKVCEKLRDAYGRRIKDEIKNFYGQRTAIVSKTIGQLWGNDKKKLAAMKMKLDNKHLI